MNGVDGVLRFICYPIGWFFGSYFETLKRVAGEQVVAAGRNCASLGSQLGARGNLVDVYSASLGAAIALTVLAGIALVFGRWRNSVRAMQSCVVVSVVAVLLNFISLIVHRLFDHSADGSSPLSFWSFITEHPAFLIVGLSSILLLWLAVSQRASRNRN